VGTFCEFGNEPSGFLKGGEYLDWLRDYQLLNIYSYLCSFDSYMGWKAERLSLV